MALSSSQTDFGGATAQVWNFGGCEFDDLRLELRVRGMPVDLELKPLEVLLQLLRHSGEVVSKERLLEEVWPGLAVVDGSLATAVSKLRKVLEGADPDIIVTVPRVGYRIGVPVERSPGASPGKDADCLLEAGDGVPGRPRWRLVRALAEPQSRGVWLAENPKTREQRVFKLAAHGSRLRNLKREVTVSRFLRESLGPRPDFARILEWNFEAPPSFIESEYGGLNLAEWAESQGGLFRIPLALRVSVLVDVARAVEAAHRVGVLHRDLKPTNILISPSAESGSRWQIKVVDFGSASVIEPERLKAYGITNLGLTHTTDLQQSVMSGTLIYLPPEVLAGKPATAAGDVYALGVILYQLIAADFRKPLSAGWESAVDDPLLREDVSKAAHGDPLRRLGSAAELVERLSRLDQRRAERNRMQQEQEQNRLAERKSAEARARRPWVITAALALAAAVALSPGVYKRVFSSSPRSATVAILPFENTAADAGIDFLRFALADEVATTLSHMRPLIIRPLASAAQYSPPSVDLQKIGKDLAASSVVAGHYLKLEDRVQISLEAVDVASNRVVWRDTINVPLDNLLSMQQQVAAITQGKLGPALGAPQVVRYTAPPPKNEKAYALYLQSLPMSVDEVPNKQALDLLRRSVALDPTYAPAWSAIAERTYAASRFGRGGRTMLDESDAAAERTLALDPDHEEAAVFLSQNLTERGELVRGYRQAKALVDRRPDSAGAHHQVGYVLRYAGLVDESARECEQAVLLDPGVLWGPCTSTFMEAGNYRRAMDFIRPDLSSEWSKAHAIEVLVRNGQEEKAREVGAPGIAQWSSYKMLLACLEHRPASEIAALASELPVDDDPEVVYFVAGHLAYCGRTQEALGMLRHAIEGNYCSYPALDRDPMFSSLRMEPEFASLRSKAISCQKSFLASVAEKGQQNTVNEP
jgi:serine/threonine protein kinase/DNA-binding winged helix-turn-helix (wHTH) protein